MTRRFLAGFSFGLLSLVFAAPDNLLAQCGVERWSVKTGTDPDAGLVNLASPSATTIATMRGWPAPSPIPSNSRVSPYETTQWEVYATLTKFKSEGDSDYHVVLTDASGNTLVGEIAKPDCVGFGSPFASGIANARTQFDGVFTPDGFFQVVSVPVRVRGVGMFDFLHGQTGMAPNGIEIHPILDIALNQSPTPDFGIWTNPDFQSIPQGGSASVTVATRPAGGFNSSVSLSVTGAPAGASVSLSSSTVAAPGNGNVTLTFSSGTAAVGSYKLTVTATGGGKTRSAQVTFSVRGLPESDHPYADNTDRTWTYTVAGSPSSIKVAFDAQTQVESGYDFIYVMDKNGNNILGSPFTATSLAGATKTVTGDTVKIRLTSDDSYTYYGFKVTSATAGSGGGSQQLFGNPGFETGSASPWVGTSGVIDNSANQPAHSGSWKAWMNGYGSTHTDTLYQQVAIPSTATSATLTFWLHVDTAETAPYVYDTLKIQVRNGSGTWLKTLATYSNRDAAAGYVQKSFSVIGYKGQTIRIHLEGKEDSNLQSSFVVDDFALTVQ